MKLIAIFALLAFANCEFDPDTFDWSSVRPITQIPEYREAFPKWFKDDELDDSARVFDRNGRIIRGEIAEPTDFPWSAGIVISFTMYNGWCSGSLVSRNYVLSAAQCFLGSETQVTVMLGASDISRVSEFLMVTSYLKHGGSNSDLDHDIALLRLQREAFLSANVQIVRLPNIRQIDTHFENQKAFTAGWGSTGASNEAIPTQRLRSIQASVISNGSCRIRYLRLRDFNICTDTEVGTPCIGDEGAPLTITEFDARVTQIGIFSYLSETRLRGCDRGFPPVFTRVSHYLDWIQHNSDVVIRQGFD